VNQPLLRTRALLLVVAVFVITAFACNRDQPVIARHDTDHPLRKPTPEPHPLPPTPTRAGTGGNILPTNGPTPCRARPGVAWKWETTDFFPADWNPCTGNLQITLAGLIYNSELNSAAHPFHMTGSSPPGGPYGFFWNLPANWYITPDAPPLTSVVVTAGDGTPYSFALASTNPNTYIDMQGATWTLTTADNITWVLTTLDGVQYTFKQRTFGILLTGITDKMGNALLIVNFNADDSIASTTDYLDQKGNRTTTYGYTGGRLSSMSIPTGLAMGVGPATYVVNFTYDPTVNDLTGIQLPPAGPAPLQQRNYAITYSQHFPICITLGVVPGQSWTYDWYQNGALVNMWDTDGIQYHMQYSNIVSWEVPTVGSPQLRALYSTNTGDTRPFVAMYQGIDGVIHNVTRAVAPNPNAYLVATQDTIPGQMGKTITLESRTLYPNGYDVNTVTDAQGAVTTYVWTSDGVTPSKSAANTGPTPMVYSVTGPCPAMNPNCAEQTTYKWNPAKLGDWRYHLLDSVSSPKTATYFQYADVMGTMPPSHAIVTLASDMKTQEAKDVFDNQFTFRTDHFDGLGAHTQYIPDAYNNLKSVVDFAYFASPIGQPETWSYTPTGILLSYADRDGSATQYTLFDELLRPTKWSATLPTAKGGQLMSGNTTYDQPALDLGEPIHVDVTNAVTGESHRKDMTYRCSSDHLASLTEDMQPTTVATWGLACNLCGASGGCPAPTSGVCQISASEWDGWCTSICQYAPACIDGEDVWNETGCPGPNPCGVCM